MSHTPATPDPQAAGLLSLERLNEMRATDERYGAMTNFTPEVAWERRLLLRHIEARDKQMQQALVYLQDICGAVSDSELMDEISAAARALGLTL